MMQVKQYAITNPNMDGKTMREINPHRMAHVNITRVRRGEQVFLVTPEFIVQLGDVVLLRGTMRGLARERRSHGVGAERPFHLLTLADGRLMLEDPDTGRRIDLGSFGPDNAAAFAALARPPQRLADPRSTR